MQQLLPLLVRQTTTLPIRARVLTPMIEEPIVVITVLERLHDHASMKSSSSVEQRRDVGGNVEVHRGNLAVVQFHDRIQQ